MLPSLLSYGMLVMSNGKSSKDGQIVNAGSRKTGGSMNRRDVARPTEGGLDILRVLWLRGSSTVRQVRDALNQTRPAGYTLC